MREKVGMMMMFTTSLETIEQLPEVKQEKKKGKVESPGIDPGASRMLSERSTI